VEIDGGRAFGREGAAHALPQHHLRRNLHFFRVEVQYASNHTEETQSRAD
jgi:hypothetical protein